MSAVILLNTGRQIIVNRLRALGFAPTFIGWGQGAADLHDATPADVALYNPSSELPVSGVCLASQSVAGVYDTWNLTGTLVSATTQNIAEVMVYDSNAVLTNINTNGGFETSAAGYQAVGAGTIARSTAQSKYGTASGLVTCPATFTGAGTTNIVLAANTQYTASCWIYHPAGGNVFFDLTDNVDLTINNSAAVTVPAGVWTRFSFSGTTDTHTATWILRWYSPSGAQSFYIDGVQLQIGATATPYIETNGSQASVPNGNPFIHATFPPVGLNPSDQIQFTFSLVVAQ